MRTTYLPPILSFNSSSVTFFYDSRRSFSSNRRIFEGKRWSWKQHGGRGRDGKERVGDMRKRTCTDENHPRVWPRRWTFWVGGKVVIEEIGREDGGGRGHNMISADFHRCSPIQMMTTIVSIGMIEERVWICLQRQEKTYTFNKIPNKIRTAKGWFGGERYSQRSRC